MVDVSMALCILTLAAVAGSVQLEWKPGMIDPMLLIAVGVIVAVVVVVLSLLYQFTGLCKDKLDDKKVMTGLGGDPRQQLKIKYGHLIDTAEGKFINNVRSLLGQAWTEMIRQLGIDIIVAFSAAGLKAIGGGLGKLAELFEKFQKVDNAADKISEALESQGWKIIVIEEKKPNKIGIVVYNTKTNEVQVTFWDNKGHVLVITYQADPKSGTVKEGTKSISFTKKGAPVPLQ